MKNVSPQVQETQIQAISKQHKYKENINSAQYKTKTETKLVKAVLSLSCGKKTLKPSLSFQLEIQKFQKRE